MQAAMTTVPMCEGCEPQAQSLMDTLHAFTAAGAYTEFMEHAKGTLKEGYLADVVVLDADMEQTAKDEVVNVRPQVTICDGRLTFEG
jgi:predicted amidohydrolase YtcJ